MYKLQQMKLKPISGSLSRYRKLHNATTREQLWLYSLLLLSPDQTIAQMWSNGVRRDRMVNGSSVVSQLVGFNS